MNDLVKLSTSIQEALSDKVIVRVTDESEDMIERIRIFFENGYGASVVRGRPGTMFENVLPPEGAVLTSDGSITYGTSITDDVVRFIDSDDLLQFVQQVADLPTRLLE